MSPGPGLKLGLGTHEYPGLQSYIARVTFRCQDGQIIPGLVMLMLALLVVGMLFFQVGRAAVFSTEAQTAADAAALAAAKNIKAQLTGMVFRSGTSDLGFIDDAQVRAAAERYASKNGAHVVRLERNGVDVRVWVSTKKT